MEVFTLQQNLAQTRQELSTALYQHDAAVRVIARLTQERDAAREALKNIQVAGPATTNGDAMHIDSAPLPEAIQAKIDSTQAGLMKTRRKRPVPAEWATSDTLSLFKPVKTVDTSCADASFISVSKENNLALVGSKRGGACTVQSPDGTVAEVVPGSVPITAGVWIGSRIALGTSTGKVQIVENGRELASFSAHSGSIAGMALHASGDILASASSDRTYALYDVESNQLLTQVQTSSGMLSIAFTTTLTDLCRTHVHTIPPRRPPSGNRRQGWPITDLRCEERLSRWRLRARWSCDSTLLFRKRHLACDCYRILPYCQHLGSTEARSRRSCTYSRCRA